MGCGLITASGRRGIGIGGQLVALVGLSIAGTILAHQYLSESTSRAIPLIAGLWVMFHGVDLVRRARIGSLLPGLAVLVAAWSLQKPGLALTLIGVYALGLVLGLIGSVRSRSRSLGVALLALGAVLVVRGLGILGLI
jgi:hypothetical protein